MSSCRMVNSYMGIYICRVCYNDCTLLLLLLLMPRDIIISKNFRFLTTFSCPYSIKISTIRSEILHFFIIFTQYLMINLLLFYLLLMIMIFFLFIIIIIIIKILLPLLNLLLLLQPIS